MSFNLKILTPTKEIFNGSVESLIVPSEEGSLGILKNHRSIISILKSGKITIYGKIKKEFLLEKIGMLKFDKNEAVILSDEIKDL